jgi:hypothetical protein
MSQRLVPFEPGMEGKFIPYEALEEAIPAPSATPSAAQPAEQQTEPKQED